MPKTLEEISKDLETLNSSVSVMKKDFELKLSVAKKDTEEWKTLAEKEATAAKEFKAKAEKADQEKTKALQDARIKEVILFLDEAVKSAKITPATKVLAEKLMESMTSDAVVHTFESKDGSKVTHTQLSLFKEFINSLPKSKIFTTLANQGGKVTAEIPVSGMGSDAEVKYMTVKKDGSTQSLVVDDYDLGVKAIEYQQENKKIGRSVSYADALIAVSIQQKQEAQSQ